MASQWISVKDRMPEDRKNVLVTINFDEQVHIAYVKEGMWYAWIDDEIEIMGDAWLKNVIAHEQLGVISWQELPKRAEWIPLENNLY
jgi:hypothetical protein